MRLRRQSIANKSQATSLKVVLVTISFALTAIFGLSLFTGNGDQSNIGISLASAQEPADMNNDNKVDIFDLSFLLGRWNTADSAADITKDGTVNIFDLSRLLTKWGAVGGGSSSGSAIPMKMISIGKPVYASSGIANYANDLDYDTSWQPSGTAWLAFDLSSEPELNRQSIVLAWFTNPDDGFSVNSYDMSCPAWSGRPYLSNYTIQVNAAPGGGNAPSSGWQTVATVTGNPDLSKQHKINFGGYNWVRVNGSGPNGISVNVDIVDASAGISDGWLFIGDSITAAYSGHFSSNDTSGVERRSFTELVYGGTAGKYRPIQQNGAMACSHSGGYVDLIDGMLDNFHGKYVTLNLGTNDSWGGQGDPAGYKSTMQTLVNKIRAKGKVPVIATIPWPNNGGSWDAQVVAFNTKIVELYNENPDIVRGPDLYTITKGKTNLYNGTGDVHLNETGGAVARKAWADATIGVIYN